MKAPHKERLIYAILDGRLPEHKKEKLKKHIESCPQCREFFEMARSIKERLNQIGSTEPSGIDWERLEAKIERLRGAASAQVPQHQSFALLFWRLGLAFAVAILLFAVYLAYQKISERASNGRGNDQLAGKPQATTPEGKKEEIAAKKLLAQDSATAFVTFTGRNVKWRLPIIGTKDLDLETIIREGTEVNTPSGSSAGIQIGAAAGIRIEPRSSVSFSKLGPKQVSLHLSYGTVSVDLPHTHNVGVTVFTKEAIVAVEGTLFSVSRRGGLTEVVVSRGAVVVTPRATPTRGEVRVDKGKGVKVTPDGGVDELAHDTIQAEKERLEKALFNMFKGQLPEEVLAMEIGGEDQLAYIEIDGKKEACPTITMRQPAGAGEVKLVLRSGREIEIPYKISEGRKMTTLSYDLSAQQLAEPGGERWVQPKRVQSLPPLTEVTEKKVTMQSEEEREEQEEDAPGYIDPYLIQVKILKEKGKMRACYEKFLAMEPKEKNVKAEVTFTVGESGRVVRASCKSNVGDKDLQSCLAEVIKSILFPKPEGGPAKFQYPITFTPK